MAQDVGVPAEPDAGKGRAGPKNIVLLSDGTGNSSAKLFRTNVWRLYDALDLSEPEPQSDGTLPRRQVAYYDDGVGTSSFKPLALLGGAFGVGLKRNVLDLYAFLCRNHVPGDQVHVFGFSRGAFTARILVGLVASQGLVRYEAEAELDRQVHDAYRRYRRERFKRERTPLSRLRDVRDAAVRTVRGNHPQEVTMRRLPDAPDDPRRGIAFLGLWDTVGAYGTPLAELTRGIDRWVWPMSTQDLELSPLVRCARHALSLDDERDTFHPLIWDETREAERAAAGLVAPDRIQQVWFAGAHSDVGGGYPDGGLAGVPLLWMLREAEEAGLRFRPEALEEAERSANPFGPTHDSRKGLAGYYRYQPRRLSAFVQPPRQPDPDKPIMRGPDMKGGLVSVKVHASVVARIRSGPDQYAPIVLPASYEVVPTGDDPVPLGESDPDRREHLQEEVWNQVWKRRIGYFLSVFVSLLLAAMPVLPWLRDGQPVPACRGPQCALLPLIDAVEGFLPGAVRPWTTAFRASPGFVLLCVAALVLLLRRGAGLQSRIHDRMRPIWMGSLPSEGLPGSRTRRAPGIGRESWIYRLRTAPAYRHVLSSLKWRWVPNIFGPLVLILLLATALAVPGFVVFRAGVAWAEDDTALCRTAGAARPVEEGRAEPLFPTSHPCWPSGVLLRRGERYLVRLRVAAELPDGAWRDASIRTSPLGFGAERLPYGLGYLAAPLRRSVGDRWFQPMARIVGPGGAGRTRPLPMERSDRGPGQYEAELLADRDGELFLFVNDVLRFWRADGGANYRNNHGGAGVTVDRLPRR